MTITDSKHDDIVVARREHAQATWRFAAGITVSVVGIATLLAFFLLLPFLGTHPTTEQGFGVLLLAAIAFAMSARGADVKNAAHKKRRATRAKIDSLMALRNRAVDA